MKVSELMLLREDLIRLTKRQLVLIAIFVPGGTLIVSGYLIYDSLKEKDDKKDKPDDEAK